MAKRVLIGTSEEFPAGELKAVKVENESMVVARVSSGVCAVKNRCAHLPLPLAGGKLEGDNIVCPWHNSSYEMCSGENKDWVKGFMGVKMPDWAGSLISFGKQPQPLTTYKIIEEDGKLYVEL
jgi:nitrite reductase/ring-hydroxylating ferredoxin subunit